MPTDREVDWTRSFPNNLVPSFFLPARVNGQPAFPPTYHGSPKEVLPPLPRTLTELRRGQYQWLGSMPARHLNWAFFGFMMGGFHRALNGMSILPMRRGIRPWGIFVGYMTFTLVGDFWLLGLQETWKGRSNMKLEILRRMRAKTIEEIRFEAQKSLEGLPQDYDGPMDRETIS
ncbi:hypothetical protein BDY24DRAFT_404652 [Mrakia frigida]|uniref:uncharacterized protein n=1 Tax=Mrakia frigida TaxID=29902 RepID=UPI003FCC0D47